MKTFLQLRNVNYTLMNVFKVIAGWHLKLYKIAQS